MNHKWSMFARVAFCCVVYGTAQTLVLGNMVVVSQSQPVIIEKVEHEPITDDTDITGNYTSGEELMSSADTYDQSKIESSELETITTTDTEVTGEVEEAYDDYNTYQYANMYDRLTDEEIWLIETVVQHEVGAFSKTYKQYIAELIYNRLVSPDYPDDVVKMLFRPNQFTGIENWIWTGIEIDEDTKEVVKEVFTNENPSHSCIAYYNPALSAEEAIQWFEYSGDVQYVFSHTETDWGITYTTRFFM